MSYDLEHTEIYRHETPPMRVHGDLICGGIVTTIIKTEGQDGFSVSVQAKASDISEASHDIVRITPAMLAAMR